MEENNSQIFWIMLFIGILIIIACIAISVASTQSSGQSSQTSSDSNTVSTSTSVNSAGNSPEVIIPNTTTPPPTYVEAQQVGGLQPYGNGVLYHELITNPGAWHELDNASMKTLLAPQVCKLTVNINMINSGTPVSFTLKVADTGQIFFVTFNMGDCNNNLW